MARPAGAVALRSSCWSGGEAITSSGRDTNTSRAVRTSGALGGSLGPACCDLGETSSTAESMGGLVSPVS
eukprot:scaffold157892_cov27-Tisochrysis_lutea.AAC.2